MARLLVETGQPKDACYNEIGLCAQHIWEDYAIDSDQLQLYH